jgi:hypothetical protein
LRSAAVKFHAENLSSNPFPASYSHEEIMMDLSLELAFRIAIVWAAGFILAVAVRALLPDQAGFTLVGGQGSLFLPFSRLGFWTCVLAALIVTFMVVIRAMLLDLGWSSFR